MYSRIADRLEEYVRDSFAEYEERVQEAKRDLVASAEGFADLREDLERMVEEQYRPDPLDIDVVTGAKPESPEDFAVLINQAGGDMKRLRAIGEYASAAAAMTTKGDDARRLRVVANKCRYITGGDVLEAFDDIADSYRQCTKEPTLFPYWDNLTDSSMKMLRG